MRAGEPEVWRVPASGGAPALVVRLDSAPGTSFHWPVVLPGGQGILVTANAGMTSGAVAGVLSVRVYDLANGAMKVSLAGTYARYAPTGHLIYSTLDQALLAVPFDVRSLTVTGRPVTVLDGLDVRNQGITDVSLSRSGTLAYTTRSLNAPETVSWVTRDGSASPVDPGWTRDWEFEGVALSPDGRRAAVVIETSNRGDVWVKQLDRGPLTRLTFGGDYNAAPTWTPDGRFVTYVSLGQGRDGVWRKAADGSGADSQLVAMPRGRLIHYAEWSRDSRWLVISAGGQSDDVFALQPGVDTVLRAVLSEPFDEFLPALSPDGRWLAYVSDESGRNEIYLRPFPDVGTGKWQLTTVGGIEPVWAPGGRELYFRSLDRARVMAVDLSRGAGSATERTVVRLPASDDFEGNPRNRLFDVGPSGRFLMIQRSNATDVSGDLVVVLNWFTELRARARQ
jgi:serine/threonine-protein kinase